MGACSTFGWETIPELYVTQTPIFNAGAYGIDDPFIVIHLSALELLDTEEQRVLLAHELGHVISGHSLYRTIAAIMVMVSLGALPMLASIILLPVKFAFLEWSRKSELSADRASLLGSQDLQATMRLFMKMAGGGSHDEHPPGRPQPRGLHGAGQRVRVLERRTRRGSQDPQHPRADPSDERRPRRRGAGKWVQSGDYERILRGEYVRRGTEQAERPLRDDMHDARSTTSRRSRKWANT
ncbi:MAG: M48 family metallopeptidase [Gemmatimonadetes bacterium]|nr:M48 family metallopeptidase [Gemmatimonadota bacterium]